MVELCLSKALLIAFSAFSIINSSPKAFIKLFVLPVILILKGFNDVNLTVSPILYLQSPAFVEMITSR